MSSKHLLALQIAILVITLEDKMLTWCIIHYLRQNLKKTNHLVLSACAKNQATHCITEVAHAVV